MRDYNTTALTTLIPRNIKQHSVTCSITESHIFSFLCVVNLYQVVRESNRFAVYVCLEWQYPSKIWIWPKYLACCYVLTISRLSSKVKVITGQGLRLGKGLELHPMLQSTSIPESQTS